MSNSFNSANTAQTKNGELNNSTNGMQISACSWPQQLQTVPIQRLTTLLSILRALIYSAQDCSAPLLLDRMWVTKLSQPQPCSKTVLFISSVTLLRNDTVCMFTGGGGEPGGGVRVGWGGWVLLTSHCVGALLMFVSAVRPRGRRNYSQIISCHQFRLEGVSSKEKPHIFIPFFATKVKETFQHVQLTAGMNVSVMKLNSSQDKSFHK